MLTEPQLCGKTSPLVVAAAAIRIGGCSSPIPQFRAAAAFLSGTAFDNGEKESRPTHAAQIPELSMKNRLQIPPHSLQNERAWMPATFGVRLAKMMRVLLLGVVVAVLCGLFAASVSIVAFYCLRDRPPHGQLMGAFSLGFIYGFICFAAARTVELMGPAFKPSTKLRTAGTSAERFHTAAGGHAGKR